MDQYNLRFEFPDVVMKLIWKNAVLFEIQKMIVYLIMMQVTLIVDLFNAVYFVAFCQHFQYFPVAFDTLQPCFGVRVLRRIDIAGKNDSLHNQKISISAKLNFIFSIGMPEPKSWKSTGKEGMALKDLENNSCKAVPLQQ